MDKLESVSIQTPSLKSNKKYEILTVAIACLKGQLPKLELDILMRRYRDRTYWMNDHASSKTEQLVTRALTLLEDTPSFNLSYRNQ